MTEKSLDGLPMEIVAVDPDAGCVRMTVDESIYPLDAIYGAAYIFIDRAYVLLDRAPGGGVRVTLSSKSSHHPSDWLRAAAGEFANELLSCAWRRQIVEANRAVIEAVTTRALSGAMGPPTLEELEKFDFSEGGFPDPLGIAVSWEEKYGDKLEALSSDGAPGAQDGPASLPETKP